MKSISEDFSSLPLLGEVKIDFGFGLKLGIRAGDMDSSCTFDLYI